VSAGRLRVLVACEFSGVVRDAFSRRGWDATSCDILPTEAPGQHIQGDVIAVLDNPDNEHRWDLVIAHPPCTYLANSGVRWLYGGKGTTPDPARWDAMRWGAWFFGRMLGAPAPRIAVENPIMHHHARDLIRENAQHPDVIQTIQPWMFGHGEVKATQLWLRNLPPLVPTAVVDGREARVHRMGPSPDRGKERSRTLTGIAEAMATQWTAALAAEGDE
jgi:hypothetical protein